MRRFHNNLSSACRAVALGCLALGMSPASFADFCSEFDSVYSIANRGFQPIRGVYDENRDEYYSLTQFPGSRGCSIEEDEFDYRFSCRWRFEPGQDSKAVAAAKELSDGIQKCLGIRYVRHDDPDPPSGKAIRLLWNAVLNDPDNRARQTRISTDYFAERTMKPSKVFPAYIEISLDVIYQRAERP